MTRRFKAGAMYVTVVYRDDTAWVSINGEPERPRSPAYVARMVVAGTWRPTDGWL